MKRTNILFLIAAAALSMSLCGIFFYSDTKVANTAPCISEVITDAEFKRETALDYLSLCSLAYDSEEITKELAARGYGEIEYKEKKQETNYSNGIAFAIGYKKNEANYVCIAIRGTKAKEWYSNFQIGESAEHAGFSAATDYVMKQTEDYLREHNIDKSNTIMQITGHSRGGAVANLCAKRMLEKGDFGFVSAYTFACPATTTSEDTNNPLYKSIHNIINPEDFICCIPLPDWNYKRYGTDLYLPKKGDENYYDLYRSMQDKFFETTQSSHRGYPDGDRDVKRFIEAVSKISPTVSDYYQKEISLFPHKITMYQYMQSAAAFLSNEQNLSDGMILLSSGTSPVFSVLADFITQGISLDSMEGIDITSSAMGCAHTYETYNAWLEVLPDSYFENNMQKE
ncbi:MAG: DUF2974 domain-containing protein [Ruminococcus sp.]|nr:DUF2974 domain-containing protein [Ruminococcus sp.]